MSSKKQGGKLTQHKRPNPKFLGHKVATGEKVKIGAILVRQRGTPVVAGKGVKVGRDHTLYAIVDGTVKFSKKLGKNSVAVI